MGNDKASQEEGFRDVLRDSIGIIEALKTYCNSPQEVIDLMSLALDNEAQCRLLMQTVVKAHKK